MSGFGQSHLEAGVCFRPVDGALPAAAGQSSADLRLRSQNCAPPVYRLAASVVELKRTPDLRPCLLRRPLSRPRWQAPRSIPIDGYYGYNFNAPIGRANRLRAYDVSSNSFSINQAGLVLENAPDPAKGKRWGARLDLQWGQATQTLQGQHRRTNRVPRFIETCFRRTARFIVPLGKGLKVDFGKWASSWVSR